MPLPQTFDAYRKYRNLPEEADAWAVGGESGGHYGNTTPNFFQRTWNRIQGNDPMTGRPTGPARPPTTGGPESSPTTGGPARPPATSGPESASTTGGPARPPAGGDPSVPRQAHADLDSLYRDAAVAQRELSQVTTSVAEQLGGRPMIPDRLKGRERAQQKIDADYDGDPSRITDLARSSIEFDNPQQIRAALEQLRTRGEFVRIKDRFERPADGYRDVMINMRMSNGHIVEVQLHLKAILDVKNGPGHALYEQIRNIDAAANKEGRPLTPDESARKAQLVAQSRALYDAAFEQSQGGPSPDQPAPPHGDASSSPTSMTGPPASDASRTDAAPPQGEGQSTHGQPQGELPQGDRGPTGTLPPAQRPRRPGMIDPGNKDLPSGRDAEGGTADGTGRMVRLRDPQRYSKFIQDASPLHKAISPQQRYEVIQSFPVVEIYSAPGHQNLRRPESMLGMSESMTKKGTGSIFDGAEPIKLNIFTDTVNGQVVVKSIEVTDGNHRLAAGLHSGKWTSIKDIPQHYLAIEVNGFDTHGKQNPRWIPLEVVQQAGIPRDQWFEVPADWGAKGPTAQVRGDVSSLDEAIPQKFRGVTLDKVIERSLERVNGDEEHGGPNPRS